MILKTKKIKNKKIKKDINENQTNKIGVPFLLNNFQFTPLLNYPKYYIYLFRPIVALFIVFLIIWIIIKVHLYFSKDNITIKDKLLFISK
jgi:hypothetical protein